ncbi:MAG: B12-binding domain-containing radical SAM protein [Promethearchaeota archaeon]
MSRENAIVKDWRKIELSFGLIYPNKYTLGMSSYSIRLLYYLINSFDNIACERIFIPNDLYLRFPASKDNSSKNILRSLETKVLPEDFDILGFSLHFENDFKNILWILEKANIPLTSQERQNSMIQRKKHFPMIIGGGPVVTSNPIPLNEIFDILFIGDSEPNLGLFFNVYLELKNNQINLDEFFQKVIKIEGIFVPKLRNKTKRSVIKDLNDSPHPVFQLMLKTSEEKNIFEGNFFVEVNRGCPYQCKFCISSFHNSPFRNRTFDKIIDIIENGMKYSNFNTISLIGSCVSSHPKFQQICEFIINRGKRLTIPSIRIEHLNKELIEIFEKGNIKTITIAPETGSENLRYVLGKKISNDKILSTLTQIRDSRIKNVKMYFLIGLPNENDANIQDLINLLEKINNLGYEKNTLRINVNPFIPKLNTPYEKEIFFYLEKNINSLIKKYQILERELKKFSSIKLKFKNYKTIIKNARLQTMISLGNQEISGLLLKYYYDGANFVNLQKIEKEMKFSMDEYMLKIKNCYSPWIML